MRKSRIIPLMIGMMIPTMATFAQPSAEPDSWDVITESLDERGTFYLYMNTEQAIEESVEVIIGLIDLMASNDPSLRNDAPRPDQIRNFVSAIGLDQVKSVGLSSTDRGDHHSGQRVRSVMEVDEKKGLLSFFDYPEESQVRLNFIPESSIVAFSTQLNPMAILTTIDDALAAIDSDEVTKQWQTMLQQSEQNLSMSFHDILSSLDGTVTAWVVPGDRVEVIPEYGEMPAMSIPRPHAALILGTRDSTIFEMIKSSVPSKILEDTSTESRLVFQPEPNSPMNFQPIIEQRTGSLLIALSPETLALWDQAIAGENIGTNGEFQDLSYGNSGKIDSAMFVSKKLKEEVMKVTSHPMTKMMMPDNPMVMVLNSKFGEENLRDPGILSIRNVESNLITWTKTGDVSVREGLQALMMPVMVPTVIAIGVPNFLEAQARSKVSRVRHNMRTMATAIETYYVDNNTYPAYTNDHTLSVNASFPEMTGVPTLREFDDSGFSTLTAPIEYLTGYFPDPFAPADGATFGYTVSPEKGDTWLLISPGHDGRYDLDPTQLRDGGFETNRDWLLIDSYDPTNGTTSGGDLWRIKQ